MKRDSKNYKVRCVGYKGKESCFTIDKVYDVIDGKITNDRWLLAAGMTAS